MKRVWLILLWAPLALAQVVPDLYIVQLSGPPAAAVAGKRGLASSAAMNRRLAIRREQAAVRTDVNRLGAQVVDSVDVVANALIVRAPGVPASQLAHLPDVARVYPVRVVKALLDHAVPLHKVPDAWQALGGKDTAGAGMKIGILDTGIDPTHPGFQDSSLQMPDGFPKADNDADMALTNAKIIVARNYTKETDITDQFGHGTAVAMAAAGVTNDAPKATITGVAPKAYIGVYKVLGADGSGSSAGVLKAMDEAVADGMDVLNFSFGEPASRPEDDPQAQAIETAAAAGVIVVVAAGNDGDQGPETISSPASAASAIAVGASENDRTFAAAAMLDGAPPYIALPPREQIDSADAVTGPLMDITSVDASGLACDPLPAGSLSGKIALILRGTCNFSVKLDNAQAAGAIGALLYTHAQQPTLADVGGWTIQGATLPAEMVSNADGLDIKARLADNPNPSTTLQFQPTAVPSDPKRIAYFSSHGPNVDQTIKPDLLAVGTNFYSATQKNNPDSNTMYDPSGYIMEAGTSFSSPLVAGAAALIKQARPGLSVQQYRSLLINSASPLVPAGASQPLASQWQGTGVLDMSAAVQDTVTAFPTSVSFGWGGGTADVFRDLTLTNIGPAADTFAVSVVPLGAGPAPSVSSASVQLDPGATQKLTLEFSANSLTAGEYQGYVQVQGTQSQVIARVPYWYGVASGTAQYLIVLLGDDTGTPSSRHDIFFRVNDSTGVPLPVDSYTPQVTVLSGGGTVLTTDAVDDQIPGAYDAQVRLGPGTGTNVFQVQVGDLTATVHIVAQ